MVSDISELTDGYTTLDSSEPHVASVDVEPVAAGVRRAESTIIFKTMRRTSRAPSSPPAALPERVRPYPCGGFANARCRTLAGSPST
jgi:hypothetical protein